MREAIEGGSIRVKDSYYLSVPESEQSEIFRGPKRYGRRQLMETGRAVCNILWDLSSFSPPEQAYWRAFELRKARFVPLPEDEHFRVWLDRNLGGQWADSHDPIQQIYQAIARINRALGEDLFTLPRDEEDLPRNPDLTYPAGDNMKAYVSAHVELEKVVVGSLNARLLDRLLRAKHIKKDPAWGTLRRLEALLHDSSDRDEILEPLKKVRRERGRVHQIDPKVFAPEDQMRRFIHDCYEVVSALELLEREVHFLNSV